MNVRGRPSLPEWCTFNPLGRQFLPALLYETLTMRFFLIDRITNWEVPRAAEAIKERGPIAPPAARCCVRGEVSAERQGNPHRDRADVFPTQATTYSAWPTVHTSGSNLANSRLKPNPRKPTITRITVQAFSVSTSVNPLIRETIQKPESFIQLPTSEPAPIAVQR